MGSTEILLNLGGILKNMSNDKIEKFKETFKETFKDNILTLKKFERIGFIDKTTKITVIDAICGKGKTQFSYQNIKENSQQKFIYVTLYKTEVDRLLNFCENEGIQIQTPKEIYDNDTNTKNKSNGLKILLKQGSNIIMTHELFKIMQENLIEYIEKYNYILYLDEVMDLVHPYNYAHFTKEDLFLLFNKDVIDLCQYKMKWKFDCYNSKDTKISFVEDKNYFNANTYNGIFTDFKDKCDNHSLYMIATSNKNKSLNMNLVYIFPSKIFTSFKEVFVMTYMFEAQLQSVYFKLILNKYELKTVYFNETLNRYELKDYDLEEAKLEFNCYKNLMNIYQGKYNDVSKKTNYSYTYLHSCELSEINKIMRNIKETVWRVSNDEILWTTVKGQKEKIKNELSKKGFKSNFISMNMRATNEYRYKTHLMYIYNKYMKPDLKIVFGMDINEDIYALSEFMQWVFRSAIRDNKPIHIFLPSERMRDLLNKSNTYFDLMYIQYIQKQEYIQELRIELLANKLYK